MATHTAVMAASDLRAELAAWQDRITLKKVGRGHRYSLDGKATYPSVTTILGARVSPRLIDWSARVQFEADAEVAYRLVCGYEAGLPLGTTTPPRDRFIEAFKASAGAERENQKQLREAGALGTEVHKLIERWVRTRLGETVPEPEVSDEALRVGRGFAAWAESVELEPVVIEQRLVHVGFGYAGTMDLLAYSTVAGERRLDVWDFKTSKGIYPEMRIQSGAYRDALHHMVGVTAGGRLLHFRKDEKAGQVPEAIEVQQPLDTLRAAFRAAQTTYEFERSCA